MAFEMRNMTKPARMTGSVRFSLDHGPRLADTVADMGAIDDNESIVIACSIRRLYGERQGWFGGNCMELAPEGPVLLRKLFFITVKRNPLPERILSAKARPFKNRSEAMRFASTGIFAPGGPWEWGGSVILRCQTDLGEMEISVSQRDLPLLLHYLDVRRRRGYEPTLRPA
jgi:hypothetical protein